MRENGTLKRNLGRFERLMEWVDGERASSESTEIKLAKGMEWFVSQVGKFPSGINYLLSGDPGVGKSTLAIQLAASAATAGEKVLYIATEQSADSVRKRFDQICSATRARKYLTIKDDLYDLSLLPHLLTNQLLRVGSPLHGTRFVIIDSLQGCGMVDPLNKKLWSSIMDYLKQSGGAGITNLALAHQTKAREIAGPKALEHSCDVTLLLRHGASCRALTIPKNRIGASVMEPYALTISPETTRLEPSSFGAAAIAEMTTLTAGGLIQIQVAITPVKHDRGFIKCPGMSIKEVETIVDLVERIFPEARSLSSLGVTVRGPDETRHKRDWNLAIAAAIIAALRRKCILQGHVLLGDLSLEGNVLPPASQTISAIEDSQAAGILENLKGLIVSSKIDNSCIEHIDSSFKYIKSINEIDRFLEEADD